jgi:hypothetical protein
MTHLPGQEFLQGTLHAVPAGVGRFGSAGACVTAAAVVCVLTRDAAGAAVEGVGGELPAVAEAFADGAPDEPPQPPGQVPRV